jgi:NAD(P)-dependent dehydrogenase (short-subunit alcohol dehydrogenase family)
MHRPVRANDCSARALLAISVSGLYAAAGFLYHGCSGVLPETAYAQEQPMKRLEGKVALVTGAGSGIGRAVALRLAAEGAHVFCADLHAESLEQTCEAARQAGGVALAGRCDVSSEDEVRATVAAAVAAWGRLDHLSNMAGILRFDHFHEIALDDFKRVIDVNLYGTFLFCRESIPHLLKTGGNIVNAASTSSHAGLPWGGVYSASKGAVLAMTRSIAVEYGRLGLRANTVSPGDIATPMSKGVKMPEGVDFSWMDRCKALHGPRPPEVVAGVIAMLASDDAAHINGEDIRIDGGSLS